MKKLGDILQTVTYGASLVLVGSVPGLFVALSDGVLGSINRLIGIAVAALWVLSVAATGRLRRLHLFHGLALGFALWYTLSGWWSVAPGDSPFLLGVIQGAILTVMLWDIYRTQARVQAAMQAFVLGGYVSTATTVANYLHGDQARRWEARFAGSGFDPNDLALLLAIGIPLAALLLRRAGGSPWLRALNALYPLAAGLVIVLTGSRGALLAAAPGYLYFLATVWGLGRAWRVGMAVALVVALGGASRLNLSQPLQRLATVGASASEDHLSGRGELWKAGWNAWGQHPWLGLGGGAFRAATESHTGLGESLIAHNTYLSVLTELGPVGFVLFIALIVLVARAAWRQTGAGRAAGLVALLVWGIGVSALSWEFRSQTWLLLGLVLAGGCAAEPLSTRREVRQSATTHEALATGGAGR